MNNQQYPWNGLTSDGKEYIQIRVGAVKGIPAYWAITPRGNFALILKLQGDLRDSFNKDKLSLSGIEIDLYGSADPKYQNLIFTLNEKRNKDIFLLLCNNLIDKIAEVSDPPTVLDIVFNLIARWKKFLSSRNGKVLSKTEIRGLMAELQALRELYLHGVPQEECMEAWRCPDYSHQDFIFKNMALEVKSISGLERNSVRITSEAQLQTVHDKLILQLYIVRENNDSPHALSLNALVSKIHEEIVTEEVNNLLRSKLEEFGYVYDFYVYDTPKFETSAYKTYEVRDAFPRIIFGDLKHGVENISYDIQLDAIEPYSIAFETIYSTGSDHE